MTQRRGSPGRGQHRRVGYHADARQLSGEHIPGHPDREHGARVQGPDLRPQHGADHGRRVGRSAGHRPGGGVRRGVAAPAGAVPPGGAEVSSSSGACARRADPAAAARSAGRPGLATTTTGAERTIVMATPLCDHIRGASQHRRRRLQAPGYALPGGRELAGHAGRQHQCRTPRRPAAATITSTAPAARDIPVRPLLVRARSTRHPRSTSAAHSSQGPRNRAAGCRPFHRHNTVSRA